MGFGVHKFSETNRAGKAELRVRMRIWGEEIDSLRRKNDRRPCPRKDSCILCFDDQYVGGKRLRKRNGRFDGWISLNNILCTGLEVEKSIIVLVIRNKWAWFRRALFSSPADYARG